jgi:TRAP-type transport system small permease protein
MGAKMDVQTEKSQVKILTAFIQILEIVAVFSLFGISAVIFSQILLRNLLSIGFPWADELSRFLHITLIFLTVPILYRERIIFKIDIFIERLPARMQNVVDVFASFVCVAFSLAFLFSFIEFMRGSWDVPSPALQMPNLLFFFGSFLGILMFLLTSLEKLICALGKKAGESKK